MLSTILLILDTEEKKTKFEHIYNEHHKKMINIAYELTKDQYDAEEAMHTALVAIAENIDKIKVDNKDMLRSYLYKTVKNAAIDIVRKKSKTPITVTLDDLFNMPIEDEKISENIINNERFQALVNKIAAMPGRYRDVLVFYFLHSLSVKEIAVLLNRKQSTIKSQLTRGKKLLKKMLEEEGIK